jgi:flagellar biosynthetic protein FliR
MAPDLPRAVLAVGLGAARTVPVTWLVTPLGGARLPAGARIAFGLLLASLAAPALGAAVARAGLARANGGLLVLVFARELVVGLVLVLVVVRLPRRRDGGPARRRPARRLARRGPRADVRRAREPGRRALPPARDAPVPSSSATWRACSKALLASYDAVPLAAGLVPGSLRAAAAVVVVASARVFEVALALAAPVIVALWLTDLALGMIARVAPQVPVYFVGLPAKGLLAVGVVLIGIGALDHALTADLPRWIELGRRWLTAWA